MTGGGRGSGGDNLMLFQCARIGDADGLVALLDQGASPNWRNPVAMGWTAVHAAVDGASDAGGDPLRAAHVLRLLLVRGADPNARNNHSKRSPLMIACHRGLRSCAVLLLAFGARGALRVKDASGEVDALDIARQSPLPSLATSLAKLDSDRKRLGEEVKAIRVEAARAWTRWARTRKSPSAATGAGPSTLSMSGGGGGGAERGQLRAVAPERASRGPLGAASRERAARSRSFKAWLERIGLAHIAPVLHAEGVQQMSDIMLLTPKDVQDVANLAALNRIECRRFEQACAHLRQASHSQFTAPPPQQQQRPSGAMRGAGGSHPPHRASGPPGRRPHPGPPPRGGPGWRGPPILKPPPGAPPPGASRRPPASLEVRIAAMDALEKLRARGPPPARAPLTHVHRLSPPLSQQRAQIKRDQQQQLASTPSPTPEQDELADTSIESLTLLSVSLDAAAMEQLEQQQRGARLGHVSPKFKHLSVNTTTTGKFNDEEEEEEEEEEEDPATGGRSPRLSDAFRGGQRQRQSQSASKSKGGALIGRSRGNRRGRANQNPRPIGDPPAAKEVGQQQRPFTAPSTLPSYLRPTKSSRKRLQPMGRTTSTSSPRSRSSPRRSSPRRTKLAVKSPKARAQLARLRNFGSPH